MESPVHMPTPCDGPADCNNCANATTPAACEACLDSRCPGPLCSDGLGGAIAVCVAMPFLSRFFDYAWGALLLRLRRLDCCQPRGGSFAALGATPPRAQPPAGYRLAVLCGRFGRSSWDRAMECNGQSPCGAATQALARLVLCHATQPAAYAAAFGCAVGNLTPLLVWLGAAVLLREALNLLCVLACLQANPAFLLLSVGASVHDTASDDLPCGGSFLALYVLAPEKIVFSALFLAGGLFRQGLWRLCMLGSAALDVCAICALVLGLRAAELPLSLGLSFAATTLGGLLLAVTLASKCPPSLCAAEGGQQPVRP